MEAVATFVQNRERFPNTAPKNWSLRFELVSLKKEV
jgi:hypothetical protein